MAVRTGEEANGRSPARKLDSAAGFVHAGGMPILMHSAATRRSFLRTAALGGASLVLAGCRTAGPARAGGGELHLALLSDTHVPADRAEATRGFKPWENLRDAVAGVVAARPAGVVICGDVARLEGKADDYRQAKALLEPAAAMAPVHVVLGNHDDRAAFRTVMAPPADSGARVKDRHITVIEHDAIRLILLDSLMFVNKTPGLLGRDQRLWLERQLPALVDRPAVLFLHHTLGERDADLLDTDRFLALLRPHAHVKAVFCGHAHVWRQERIGQLHVVTLPSLGYTFSEREPVGWVDARFRRDGADLTLRALAGNRDADGRTVALAWAG